MEQARDFLQEAEALARLLAPLDDAEFALQTQFKGWTINEIIQHLLFFDRLAGLSVTDPAGFDAAYAELNDLRVAGMSLTRSTDRLLGGLRGVELRRTWETGTKELAALFEQTDPKARVKWVGPDMSARSSITARLMETWAHAQAIYDVLGVRRVNADGIANIVRLGMNTFGWTFANRGEAVPEQMPQLRLFAPSGVLWTYGDDQNGESIEGLAEEFCMVVTQTRNIADTSLRVNGPIARRWMEVAQCFAGPPRTPPQAGTRYSLVDQPLGGPKAPASANASTRESS